MQFCVKSKQFSSTSTADTDEPRTLGLAMVPGNCITSIAIDDSWM